MRLFISKKITKNWKRFARNLEVKDEVIDQIDVAEDLYQDKVLAVFKHFNENVELKWNQTKDVLKEIGLDIVTQEFEKEYLQAGKHSLFCKRCDN